MLLSPLRDVENGAGLKLLYSLRGTRSPPRAVMIITLDSQSARALNLPTRPERWPRQLHARLVEGLIDRGAGAIGFDVLFEREREPDGDQALAAALRRAGNVVLVESVAREEVKAADGRLLASADRRVQPLPLFREAAWASGPFIMPKTPDGVVEFWSHIPSVGDQASLPMLLMQRMHSTAGLPPAALAAPDNRRRTLNLYGPIGSIRTIPYHEALRLIDDPTAGAAAFGGKAVLVGFSEFNQSRQSDMFRTAFSTADGLDVSGVELCATALGNLLDDSALRQPEEGWLIVLLLGWSVALILPWRLARTSQALMLTGTLALAWIGFAVYSFSYLNLWLPVIVPGFAAPVLAVVFGLGLHVLFSLRRERQLEHALELGLTRQGNEKLALMLQGHQAGRTVHGVCLCSDIEGYTTLSETLSPEATRDALNRYFNRFIPVVEAHGGHVMDIVGDSILSLWLAEDSAAAACSGARAAALELHRLMNGPEDGVALKTRFGLHYGPVFLGEVGATHHREIRAVGDIVNTSSRIQGLNKLLGTRVLASSAVLAVGGDGGNARPLGQFVLAGKNRPIEIHELRAEALSAALAEAFETARLAYAGGAVEQAAPMFARILEALPGDGPSRFYHDRCQAHLGGQSLPDSDGCIGISIK